MTHKSSFTAHIGGEGWRFAISWKREKEERTSTPNFKHFCGICDCNTGYLMCPFRAGLARALFIELGGQSD